MEVLHDCIILHQLGLCDEHLEFCYVLFNWGVIHFYLLHIVNCVFWCNVRWEVFGQIFDECWVISKADIGIVLGSCLLSGFKIFFFPWVCISITHIGVVFTGSISRLGKDWRLNWTGPEKTENMRTSKDQDHKRPHKDRSKWTGLNQLVQSRPVFSIPLKCA